MRTTGRARRGTRATTACRWRGRVVPRDAGHRGQRVLSRLSQSDPSLTMARTGSSRRALTNHTAHLVQRDSGFQLGHPPSGAGFCVRGNIAAGTKLDGDVIRRRVIAAQVADCRHGLRELIHTLEVDREQAVVAGRPAQWLDLAWERRGPHRY